MAPGVLRAHLPHLGEQLPASIAASLVQADSKPIMIINLMGQVGASHAFNSIPQTSYCGWQNSGGYPDASMGIYSRPSVNEESTASPSSDPLGNVGVWPYGLYKTLTDMT